MAYLKHIHYKNLIITLAIAIAGGALFELIHIPVPWLLGPMVAMVLGKNMFHWEFVWPYHLRDTGLVIVGYTIGLSMTAAALHEMAMQLPTMLFVTVLLMLICAGIAFIVSRLSDSDYRSALLGSIPGGLTQVIVLAEETKGINLAVVTVTQVIRLMMIVIAMPLLVWIPFFGQHAGDGSGTTAFPVEASVSLFPHIILFALVGIALAWAGDKIHFPTAFLLGPMIGTIVLQVLGFTGPHLPAYVINAAQLLIGTHVGLMLKASEIEHKTRTFSLAIGSGLLLLTGSILLSFLLGLLQDMSRATALLGTAPGGMDQMGIIAHAIGANLSIVSGYQLFRTFFIYFAIPPILKLMFKLMEGKKKSDRHGVTTR